MVLFGIWGSASNDLYVVGGVATAGDGDAGANAPDGGTAPTAAPTPRQPTRGWSCTRPMAGELADRRGRGHSVPAAARVRHPDGATVYAAGDCGSVAHTTDHGASWSRSGTTAVAVNDNDYDFTISDVWVSPAGTSYLLEDGSGYVNPDSPYDQHVCRAIDVELDGASSHRPPGASVCRRAAGSAPPRWACGAPQTTTCGSWAFSILWHRS